MAETVSVTDKSLRAWLAGPTRGDRRARHSGNVHRIKADAFGEEVLDGSAG